MCIKIICNEDVKELDMSLPLEEQVADAKEVLVNYDPIDPKIEYFVCGVERMINNGITCNMEIKVNTNNTINGMKLERLLEKLKTKLEVNAVIKGLTKFHVEADQKLCEISNLIGKINE